MHNQTDQSPLKAGEFFFAALITGFSVVALWQAYEISHFSGLSTPGIFPMLAAGTMLISAGFILKDSLIRKRLKKQHSALEANVLTMRLVIVIALVAAYVISMPYIGFMLSSAAFLFISFLYLWRKSLSISILLTVGTLLIIYLIFRVLFQVVLPRGSLIQGLL